METKTSTQCTALFRPQNSGHLRHIEPYIRRVTGAPDSGKMGVLPPVHLYSLSRHIAQPPRQPLRQHTVRSNADGDIMRELRLYCQTGVIGEERVGYRELGKICTEIHWKI
jgi:hypothetical protein